MKVIKRNGQEQDFFLDKIKNAISKANKSVAEEYQMSDDQEEKVISTVQKKLEKFDSARVEDIQDMVEAALVKHNKYEIAKSYIIYRQNKKDKKKFTDTEEKCLAIISGESAEARGDNANKHIDVNSSARDYVAGTVNKAICEKVLPKEIVEAHKKGLIHWHDSDYFIHHMHNCDLLDIYSMLKYGFMMGDTWIDPPKRFSTGCNLAAQIALIVSGSQYGGQTMSWSHLLQLIPSTIDDCKVELMDIMSVAPRFVRWMNHFFYKKMIEKMVKRDIHIGIKTYQYQILCHHSSNGQTPFVSNNICLREAQTPEELKWLAYIIEEILKRRIKGVKDKSGKYVPPLFPKLLYWVCEGLNVEKTDPYYYLTKLAAKCITKRMQPDINSEEKSREIKGGQILPSMGCRSWLKELWEEVEYPITTVFNWQVINESNVQYKNAPSVNFNYLRKDSYYSAIKPEVIKNDYSKVVINFNGNSGWVVRHDNEKLVVLQPKIYGRWNNGVVTINLPYIALEALTKYPDDAKARLSYFYEVLDSRLELCHKALLIRNENCKKIKAKNSPILWMFGALYRNHDNPDLTVGEIMEKYPKRYSISLGYVGLYETCIALSGQSNTTEKGRKLSKEILNRINDTLTKWKETENIPFSLYGTPEESLTYKFSMALQRDFGYVEHITDKDYIVNSYHVDPREEIDAFSKLNIEGEYLALSSGGAVSYVETVDLTNNPEAIEDVIRYMYHHIAYAEFNRKIGICYKCGFQGDIPLSKTENGEFVFTCPKCGNKDDKFMNITARLCGYIGKVNAGETNRGRLDDIYHRVVHLQ